MIVTAAANLFVGEKNNLKRGGTDRNAQYIPLKPVKQNIPRKKREPLCRLLWEHIFQLSKLKS